jgi:hypothetical protein
MKLEFLAEGSDDCPLIRLYDFDVAGAMRLREAFRTLANGSRRDIPPHEEWWIEPIAECHLDLRLGVRDLGIVQRLPMTFDCALTDLGWADMASLVDPFCTGRSGECSWLDEQGEVRLLLSGDGKWRGVGQ